MSTSYIARHPRLMAFLAVFTVAVWSALLFPALLGIYALIGALWVAWRIANHREYRERKALRNHEAAYWNPDRFN